MDTEDYYNVVDCYRCGGTGKVRAIDNELDQLVESLRDIDEVDEIISGVISAFNVRKNKRKHIERIIRAAFDCLKQK